jgi:hypothetical protein
MQRMELLQTGLLEGHEQEDKVLQTEKVMQTLLQSRHEVYVFASMVVSSLPFPPLPVIVLRGEDGDYGTASSFDLLQQSIIVQQTGCRPPGDLVKNKREILDSLTRDMTMHYERASSGQGSASICSKLWVDQTYEIYCNSFRNYMVTNYATCTQDLRFHDINTVDADSILVQQGTSHWKAGRLLSEKRPQSQQSADSLISGDSLLFQESLPSANACFTSYKQMLRSYGVDLATLPV